MFVIRNRRRRIPCGLILDFDIVRHGVHLA
jgi:hypothetical protein